jgi:hypothetical protein
VLLFQSSDLVSLDSIRELLRTHFQSTSLCWSDQPLPRSFKWSLVSDSKHLWFCASLPFPTNERRSDDVTFVEGLWNKDVVELFLLNPSTGNYIEFNFSPTNAWWCCEFESYRAAKILEISPKLNHLECHSDDSSWDVVAALDLQSLPFPIDSSTLVHISGIIQQQQPRPIYLTSNANRPSHYDPDFHRIDCFLPLVDRPIRISR